MKPFFKLLGYALIAATTNNFVWFALTYWVYLSTKSVVSTGVAGGIYLVATVLSGFWFGSLVDHYKKKYVLMGASLATLCFFVIGYFLYTSQQHWLYILIVLLFGVISGNIIGVAVPTLVPILVDPDKHARANGMFGTVMGISFAITSVASGLVLGYGGMQMVLLCAIVLTIAALVYISIIAIPEKQIIHLANAPKRVDIKGTIKVVAAIPGLFALIFYTTFNNFLGGAFMALMDAYGLSLVSVQTWGMLWGVLSFGFIIGGLFIAKFGLGKNPLVTLFRINIVAWCVCMVFTLQPSIVLLAIGMMIWMSIFPFIEASEQTIIQQVVPQERQGRVFGFAHSVEQAASPLTAFLIGPITQFIFIPFMTTGRGVDIIGSWFGTGPGRGIALVFTLTGAIGLIVTLSIMRSPTYVKLSQVFLQKR